MNYTEARRLHAEQRLRHLAELKKDPLKIRVTTGDDFAAQQRDDNDERDVSRREPRIIDGQRRVWNDRLGCWVRQDAKRHARLAPRTTAAPEPATVKHAGRVVCRFRHVVTCLGQEIAWFQSMADAHNAKSKMAHPRRLLKIEVRA